MARSTTITENGRNIPYEEWLVRTVKKLKIKLEAADTPEQRAAVNKEIRETRNFMDFVKGNWRSGGIEYL